jgi:AcrR family transcriptional regulator
VRADAQRKYDRIVEVATQVIVEKGADTSLNEIARRAEVGPGTLYRHFPTREDLLDAVIKNWVEHIETAADRAVTSEQPPREVLLTWFEDVVAHISQHAGFPARLLAAMDNPGSPLHGKCRVLIAANAKLMDRLSAEGAIHGVVEPTEICRLATGVAAVADQAKLEPSAVRPLLSIVVDRVLTVS